ncbi:hypothetical protein [Bradyrhizobium sp. BR 1432]|uniref:hypothetical protein n=1 Tax=Bradyrhizobium sp. BR 1432 TaxID=3447966 RepID=UPI003EE7FA00
MTSRRTDFVLDLLDFMEEKLREALRDETSPSAKPPTPCLCCATAFATTRWC